MEPKAKDQLATARSGFGPLNDLRSVHSNGSASLGELREFLGKLHGKSPQEVIGIVSANMLVQSMLIATAATIALLVVFTVWPYLTVGPHGQAVATKPEAPPSPPATAAEAKPAVPVAAAANQPDAAAADKALGSDEAKPAEPGKNPLDRPDLDKLLDKVE
jgi:hypothetical protein